MWLDVVFISPIVIYGLDQILKNKKSKLYIISLFVSIVSNYYISYMLCLFCILYFLFRIITKYNLNENKKIIMQIILKFIIHSLLAAFLASFMIIPVIDDLKNASINYYDFSNSTYKNIFSIFIHFNVANISKNSLYISPYIFCGYFVFSILINYLFFQKDNGKKILVFFLLFLILGFTNTFLLKLWHGFRIPTLFFHRWSFLFSLFTIVIASEKYLTYVILSKKQIFLTVLGYSVLMVISIFFANEQFNIIYFIGIFFLFENLLILNSLKKQKNIFYLYCLFIIFILEIFFSCKCNFMLSNLTLSKNKYKMQDRQEMINYFSSIDSSFYRVGIFNYHNSINELFLKKSSLTSFISGQNKNLSNFLEKSGYMVNANEIYDNENLDIMNQLLGIKYWYGETNDEKYKQLENMKFSNKNIHIYKEENFLQLGYLIKNNKVQIDTTNPFAYQNSFFKTLFGYDIYIKYEYDQVENKYYVNNKHQNIYFYATTCLNKNLKNELSIYLNNDVIIQDYCKNFEIKKFNTKNYENSTIKLSEENNYNKVYFYYVDENKYNDMINYIQNNQIKNVLVKKNTLKFDINSSGNNTLLLTIPYEKGWTILVDGKRADAKKIFDTFIGIDLSNGYHKIRMIYYPRYLKLGILLSTIDFVLLLIYCKKMSIKSNNI